MWIPIYGVSCHGWCAEFFMEWANSIGSFICLDENTENRTSMDIAKVMVKVPVSFRLKEYEKVMIDGIEFKLVFREDVYGLVRIIKNNSSKAYMSSESSSSEELNHDFGVDSGGGGGEEFNRGDRLVSDGLSNGRFTDTEKLEEEIIVRVGRKLANSNNGSEDSTSQKATFHVSNSFDLVAEKHKGSEGRRNGEKGISYSLSEIKEYYTRDFKSIEAEPFSCGTDPISGPGWIGKVEMKENIKEKRTKV